MEVQVNKVVTHEQLKILLAQEEALRVEYDHAFATALRVGSMRDWEGVKVKLMRTIARIELLKELLCNETPF